MTRRPRRTWPLAVTLSLGATAFAGNAAALDVRALHGLTTAQIVTAVVVSYLAIIVSYLALAYSGSVAVNAGRGSYRRRVYEPTGRPQYTPEQLAEHWQYAQADTLAYARQAAAWAAGEVPGVTRRHAAPEPPRRIDDTVLMPPVDENAEWPA